MYDENGTSWKWKNEVLCTISAVDNAKLSTFDIKQDVYYGYINWALWMKAVAAGKIKYSDCLLYTSRCV